MKLDKNFQVFRLIDTYPQEFLGEFFSYRYAYIRSRDSRGENEPGQDYLTYSEKETTFSFALCDGVSQSFFGDIASKFLGDELLLWLNEQQAEMNITQIKKSLTFHLSKLTDNAKKAVKDHYIGTNTPAMLQAVLEEKRALGSESMFICGRIDLVSPEQPQGRIILAWMGDGNIRMWNKKGEETHKGKFEPDVNMRWSTNQGIVGGEPSLYVSPLSNQEEKSQIHRVLAYTDGFGLLDQEKERLSKQGLNEIINESLGLAENDDMSMIEIWFD